MPIRVKLSLNCLLFAMLFAWALADMAGSALRPDAGTPTKGTAEQAMSIRPNVPGSSEWLIERHDCWRAGESPGAGLPGHAVVLVDGVPKYVGARLTGWALEHMGSPRVKAFCR